MSLRSLNKELTENSSDSGSSDSGSSDSGKGDPSNESTSLLNDAKSAVESLTKAWCNNESRVLVLYTGGTIGMRENERGALVPAPNSLEKNVRDHPQMNNKDMSNAEYPNSPFLVFPTKKKEKRIIYMIYEYSPLIDSCNMTTTNWEKISKDIGSVYQMFDGFVVLHGTDTMGYTASALSFLFENLGKPVVVTGSQIPIYETRSDGRDNFIGALIIAGGYKIPEVCLFFNHRLLRGNRSTKISTSKIDAFNSPDMLPLAEFGIDININHRLIFNPPRFEKFNVSEKMYPFVEYLCIFPFISKESFEGFFKPPTQGVVIQMYGAGNIPSDWPDIIEIMKEATDRGVIIVNVTQCAHGNVSALYATGAVLAEAGIIPGFDITPEAALTKLSYVLGKDWDLETKRKAMKDNIRGEMTKDQEETNLLEQIGPLRSGLQIASRAEACQVELLLFQTILYSAVDRNDYKCLEELFDSNFDLNIADTTGWTALHRAARDGNVDIIKWFCKHGGNVHVRDSHGQSPLMIAIDHNQLPTIKLLVDLGAYLTESSLRLGEQLCKAAARRDVNQLIAYQYAGVRLDCIDQCGRNALHVACTVGSKECAQLLIEAGVSPQSKDKTQITPLMCAEKSNHFEIVELISTKSSS